MMIRKQYYIFTLLLIGGIVLLLWYQALASKKIEAGGVFYEALPTVKIENFVDVGVVDFDGDGYFDIFTSNHNQKSLLLKSDGTGGFTDVLTDMGLDQSAEFPGIELANSVPDSKNPGFYIFWKNKELVLKWRPGSGSVMPIGRIVMSSRVKVNQNSGFKLNVSNHNGEAGGSALICDRTYESSVGMTNPTIVEFSADSEAELHIVPDYIGLPVAFELGKDLPLENVYVGQNGVTPKMHDFSFELEDRHGMAWADYNGDDLLDVYIARGGLKGHMGRLHISYKDELYKKTDTGYVNVINETNIDKKTCPAYQLQWVDFNNDNALDLYISCQRRNKNQLFLNDGSGKFTEVAAELGIDVRTNNFHTPFLWIDINQDKKVDLLVNYGDDYLVMINTGSGFKAESKRLKLPGALKMTVNDYDKDGDLDVFVVSSTGFNTLLKNNDGVFEQIPGVDLGLPESALTADWVDYDNDGIVELYIVPGGIYRQKDDGGFEKTGLLDHALPESMFQAIANWVDLDNDGDRDLVLAVYYKDPLWQELYERLTGQYVSHWKREYMPGQIRRFINKSEVKGNHWLQLELVGLPGNVQAIGAKVTLRYNGTKEVALVGESEGSHLSQGHYRLYFGLGSSEKVESIEVDWPDGSHQVYDAPLSDRLVQIKQADS